MALPVVASFTSQAAGGTGSSSVTLTKPAGVQVGDLLMMIVGNEESLNGAIPAIIGWTQAYEIGSTVSDCRASMFWRIADGTEGTTQLVPWDGTNDAGGGWYLRITGAATSLPIHVVGTSSQVGNSTTLTMLAVTTSVNNCLAFSHLSFDGANGTPFTPSGTGWGTTVPANQELLDGPANTGWSGVWITKAMVSAGSTQAQIMTASSSDGMTGIQFAIKEAQAITLPGVADTLHAHTVDNVVLVENKTLAVQDSTHAHTVDSVVLTQKQVLATNNSLHAHTADNIDLALEKYLVVQDSLHAHIVDNITLTQAQVLVTNDTVHDHTVDSVTLSVKATLVVQDSLHGHIAESPVLVENRAIVVDDTLHNHTVDSVVLTTTDVLTINDTLHSHIVDNVTLLVTHNLVVDDSLHGHTVDNVILVESRTLVVDDTIHNHSAENIVLTQHLVLAVDDTLHSHTADNVTLVKAGSLSVQSSNHAHTVDSPALTQEQNLVVQDSLHDHTVDNVILSEGKTLITDDALHGHTVDNVTLVQDYNLTVDDTVHNHLVDNITLLESVDLTVQDSHHDHTVDNVTLAEEHTLSVDDTVHSHTVDNVILEQNVELNVDDCLHNHTVDNVSLVSTITLTVQDSFHNHTVDNLILVQDYQLSVDDSIHLHTATNVILTEHLILVVADTLHNHTVDTVILETKHILGVNDTFHNHLADVVVFDISAIKIADVVAKFESGDSVKITIYDLSNNSIVINNVNAGEIGSTGYFKYKYQMLLSSDVDFLYIMSDGIYEQSGKLHFTNGNLIGQQAPFPPSAVEIWNSDTRLLTGSALTPSEQAQITAIKERTDNLPDDPSDASDVDDSIDAAVVDIKGAEDRDLTEVYNNTPSIDASSVWNYVTRTLTSPSGPTKEDIRQEMDANSTEFAAIKAKTDNLPSDPADASDVNDQIDAAVVDIKGISDRDISELYDSLPAEAPTVIEIRQEIDDNSTQIAVIAAKTNNLPPNPSDVSDIPTKIEIRTEIDSNSTKLIAIKERTDNLPNNPTDVSDIPTAVENADQIWEEPALDHENDGTIGDRIRRILFKSR